MQPERPATRLHHVGIIIPNRERLNALLSLLGLCLHHEQYVSEYEADCVFAGEAGSYLEFIVPRGGKLARFNRGLGGLHHIALEIQDLPAFTRHLHSRGFKLLEQSGVAAGAMKINFLPPVYTRGITVEFVEVTSASEDAASTAEENVATDAAKSGKPTLKLAQALALLRQLPLPREDDYAVFLACGFTPLHLTTFLAAYLATIRLNRAAAVRCGLYGDLAGNLERAAAEQCGAVVVALEWSDLDPRLGYRHAVGWRPEQIPDILETASRQMDRLRVLISNVARQKLVVLALPSLPLPPLFLAPPVRGDATALQIESRLLQFATALAGDAMIRVLNRAAIDGLSPAGERLDLASELRSGFPYTLPHASVLGRLLAELLQPTVPKKGIITDLDNTLWNGILGEDGIEGTSWHLDRKSYGHALYQALLASLADSGVLVGVASKNDPDLVARALRREDLLISADMLFPVEASWSAKSESVRRILRSWNIGPESVVFINDSPLETAEVAAAFPAMECRLFPQSDERKLGELLADLRGLFGKSAITEEDRLRMRSLRTADDLAGPAGTTTEGFLASLKAEITLRINQPDQRAFELINKTNQFNLNGRRIGETQWKTRCEDGDHFLVTCAYQDKFGPLGTISVAAGFRRADELLLDTWVLSCRAFSRRIEHHVLRELFEVFGAESIVMDFLPTERNAPLQEFLSRIAAAAPQPSLRLPKRVFLENCPLLYAKVHRQ